MKNKIIFCILIIAIITTCFFSFKDNKDADTLIIGTAANYAPFVSINPQGEYEGFDIDIAQEIGRILNKKVIIQDLGSMAPLFMALEQGSIDLIIWGLSITQERVKKVSMVRYQGEKTTAYSLIFWKQIPAGISSIEDMKGMTVCVEPASAQDSALSAYPFVDKKSTERVDDALLNIQYAKADAALVEPAIAKKFKNKYPEIEILDLPLSPENQVEGIGIVIKKSNAELTQTIQQAVEILQRNGAITQLEEKWNIS